MYLSILLLVDIWVVYSLMILQKNATMNIFMFFRRPYYALLLGVYLGSELLGHRIIGCSAIGDIAKQYYKVIILICIPTSSVR